MCQCQIVSQLIHNNFVQELFQANLGAKWADNQNQILEWPLYRNRNDRYAPTQPSRPRPKELGTARYILNKLNNSERKTDRIIKATK